MRQPRFNIKKFTKNGHTFYGIFVPARINPSGKEGYFYYHTKAEAELKKQELLSATSAENRAHVLSRVQIIDAQRALERLENEGLALSLTQAVEAALPHLKASAAGVEVDALLGEFAQVKAEGWSALSARNFATVSKVFLAEFAGRKLASITVRDLQTWLSARYASAASRAFAVRTLRPAWSYAVRQGQLSENPWMRLEREKCRAKDEIDIYTPDEARRLLACAPPDFQAAFAILLFAGVRPAELTRLVWADIRDGFIRIRASISKTQQARRAYPAARLFAVARVGLLLLFGRVRLHGGKCSRQVRCQVPFRGLQVSFAHAARIAAQACVCVVVSAHFGRVVVKKNRRMMERMPAACYSCMPPFCASSHAWRRSCQRFGGGLYAFASSHTLAMKNGRAARVIMAAAIMSSTFSMSSKSSIMFGLGFGVQGFKGFKATTACPSSAATTSPTRTV